MTNQQEKELAGRLMDLKMKKKHCAGLKGKELQLKSMTEQLDALKGKIENKNKEILKVKTNLKDTKNKLNELKDTKIRNPKIEENDSKIEGMKKEKDELIEKRKKVQAQIQEKQKEHERMMQEIEKQIKIENLKKEIVKEIKEKEGYKNALLKEMNEIDPYKFDILAHELKKQKGDTMSLSLVKSLTGLKLSIPSNEEEKENVVRQIQEKKKEYENSIVKKVEEINKKIREIEGELVKKRGELEKMPVVEVSIKRE